MERDVTEILEDLSAISLHLTLVTNSTRAMPQLLSDLPHLRFLASIVNEARRAAVPSVVRLARENVVWPTQLHVWLVILYVEFRLPDLPRALSKDTQSSL